MGRGRYPICVQQSSKDEELSPCSATVMGRGGMETASVRIVASPVRHMLAPASMRVQRDLSVTDERLSLLIPRTLGRATTLMTLAELGIVVWLATMIGALSCT
jgi:hypothetical protein